MFGVSVALLAVVRLGSGEPRRTLVAVDVCRDYIRPLRNHVPVRLPSNTPQSELRFGDCYVDVGQDALQMVDCHLRASPNTIAVIANAIPIAGFYTQFSEQSVVGRATIDRASGDAANLIFDSLIAAQSVRWDYSNQDDVYDSCAKHWGDASLGNKAYIQVVTEALKGGTLRSEISGKVVPDTRVALVSGSGRVTSRISAAGNEYVALLLTPFTTVCSSAAAVRAASLAAQLAKVVDDAAKLRTLLEGSKNCSRELAVQKAAVETLHQQANDLTKQLDQLKTVAAPQVAHFGELPSPAPSPPQAAQPSNQ